MHLKNIHPCLYAFDLDSGDEIRLDAADSPVCFLIAEYPREESFIREKTAAVLRTGCRRFRLYGEHMSLWYFGVQEMGEEMDPESWPDFPVQTRSFAADTGFASELRKELGKKGTKPVLLLYDNRQEAAEFLFRILIGEPSGFRPDGGLPDKNTVNGGQAEENGTYRGTE